MKPNSIPPRNWEEKMDFYLRGKWPVISTTTTSDEKNQIKRRARRWTNELLAHMNGLNPLQKANLIETLASVWNQCRQDSRAKIYFEAFKSCLTGPWQYWQEKLLNVYWLPQLKIHHSHISINPDISIPHLEQKRYQVYEGRHPTHAAYVGSSFCQFDLKPQIGLYQSQVLDSAFTAILLDSNGDTQGFVLALGDGAGGHLGDHRQDRSIGRTSYFASKQVARLLASYPNSSMLIDEIKSIISPVNKTIQRKTAPDNESTTLIAIRGFWKPGEKLMTVVGLNIGDSLLWYWHPETEKLYSLGSAKQWISTSGQIATALLPNSYKPQEIHFINQKLPTDGVFFACSDGGYEYLPKELQEKKDDQLGTICTLSLEEKELSTLLKPLNFKLPVKSWLQDIQKMLSTTHEIKRTETYEQAKKIIIDYEKNLAAIKELEEKVKNDSEKLISLGKETHYLELKKSLDENINQLTQARIGDDILMVAWSWPRFLPSGIPQEEKCPQFISNNCEPEDWKHPDIKECNEEIKKLQNEQKEYAESKQGSKDYTKNLKSFDRQIDALKNKIKSIEKFPNVLYEVLRPAIEHELLTEEEITINEEDIIKKLEPMLKDLQQRDIDIIDHCQLFLIKEFIHGNIMQYLTEASRQDMTLLEVSIILTNQNHAFFIKNGQFVQEDEKLLCVNLLERSSLDTCESESLLRIEEPSAQIQNLIKEILKRSNLLPLDFLLRQRNKHGDTILTFALQSKCYRLIQTFLPFVSEGLILTIDNHGNSLLDIIYGHRLVSNDTDARVRSQAGLIKDLRSLGYLDPLKWHREPKQGNFAIHLAVQKAVFTGQIQAIQVLLNENDDPSPVYPDGPWMTQLQLLNGEGDTPLHLAIKLHFEYGTGLPVIEYLLTPQKNSQLHAFKNILFSPNRAGQTVFDLAQALYQVNSISGRNVLTLLHRAYKRYQEKLSSWQTDSNLRFQQKYETLKKTSPGNNCFPRLFECYQNFYDPILENDSKKMESLLERIDRLKHPACYDIILITSLKTQIDDDLLKTIQELSEDNEHPILIKLCADEKYPTYRCYGNTDGTRWQDTILDITPIQSIASHFPSEGFIRLELSTVNPIVYQYLAFKKAHTATDLGLVESFLTLFDERSQELKRYQNEVRCLEATLGQENSWRTASQLTPEETKKWQKELGAGRFKTFREKCRDESAAGQEIEHLKALIIKLEFRVVRDQIKADFYREVYSRVQLLNGYRTLFNSLGQVTLHLPKPMVTEQPPLDTSKIPLEGEEAFQAVMQQALQYAKNMIVNSTGDAHILLKKLMVEFGSPAKKANIISCFDFDLVAITAHSTLLEPLFHQQFPELTLRHCQVDDIWKNLFQSNKQLRILELIDCKGLRSNQFEKLAEWCPKLERLVIRGSQLTSLIIPRSFPKLSSLELDTCHSLTQVEYSGDYLEDFTIHNCDHLTKMKLIGVIRLQSIGCRNTPSWRVLETDQKTLAPLARELKIAGTQQGLSRMLSLERDRITPVHRAAKAGELAVVRWLVDKDVPFNLTTIYDQTPLYLATENGQIEVAKYLVSAGAAVDMSDFMKRTALHQAAVHGYLKIVKILCKAGANPMLRDEIKYRCIIFYEKFPMEAGNLYLSVEKEAKRFKVQSLHLNAPKYFGKTEYEELQKIFEDYKLNSGKPISEIKEIEIIEKITILCDCQSTIGNLPIDLVRQYRTQNNADLKAANAIENYLAKYMDPYLESKVESTHDKNFELKYETSAPTHNLRAPVGGSALFQPMMMNSPLVLANRLYQAIENIHEKEILEIFAEIKTNDNLKTQLLKGNYLPTDKKESPIQFALQMVKVCEPDKSKPVTLTGQMSVRSASSAKLSKALAIVKLLLSHGAQATPELRETINSISRINPSLIDGDLERLAGIQPTASLST